MLSPPEPAPEIARVLDAHEDAARTTLLELRKLIHEAAEANADIGELDETLKWGQPSYTPKKRGIGSSVRLGVTRDGAPALFFICHTNLVERFRQHYTDALRFEGDRAIVIEGPGPLPAEALRHCIAMALTYHRKG